MIGAAFFITVTTDPAYIIEQCGVCFNYAAETTAESVDELPTRYIIGRSLLHLGWCGICS